MGRFKVILPSYFTKEEHERMDRKAEQERDRLARENPTLYLMLPDPVYLIGIPCLTEEQQKEYKELHEKLRKMVKEE